MTDISEQRREAPDSVASADDSGAWRNWLLVVLSLGVICSITLWLAVVLIDPFSTGRFALTQRIDITTTNSRLADVAVARNRNFNGAIFGDSVSITLDPRSVARGSNWRLAQLGIYAADVSEVTTVASAFEREHRDGRTLEIFVLSNRWCGDQQSALKGNIPFPYWLYDTSNAVYLSRLLSPEAVSLSLMRLKIWLGKARPELRDDGYLDRVFVRTAVPLPMQRPSAGPAPMAPFPAIDALTAHIAALPDNREVAIVFAPLYVGTLPVAGSVAAARLDACKQRLREVAARRPHVAYLDLMTENSLTLQAENYFDPLHLVSAAVPQFETSIARLIEKSGLKPE
jgi:hypothetical protein